VPSCSARRAKRRKRHRRNELKNRPRDKLTGVSLAGRKPMPNRTWFAAKEAALPSDIRTSLDLVRRSFVHSCQRAFP
jgi:hypothetical protein